MIKLVMETILFLLLSLNLSEITGMATATDN